MHVCHHFDFRVTAQYIQYTQDQCCIHTDSAAAKKKFGGINPNKRTQCIPEMAEYLLANQAMF